MATALDPEGGAAARTWLCGCSTRSGLGERGRRCCSSTSGGGAKASRKPDRPGASPRHRAPNLPPGGRWGRRAQGWRPVVATVLGQLAAAQTQDKSPDAHSSPPRRVRLGPKPASAGPRGRKGPQSRGRLYYCGSAGEPYVSAAVRARQATASAAHVSPPTANAVAGREPRAALPDEARALQAQARSSRGRPLVAPEEVTFQRATCSDVVAANNGFAVS